MKGTMLDVWKNQFSIANFSLDHKDPSVFHSSQWQKKPTPSICYLIYRILITAFLCVSLILSMVDEKNLDEPFSFRVKWTIYLTNWGFLMCTLQAVLCTITLCARFHASRKGLQKEENNAGMYKIYWVINIIATDFSIAITVLYWTAIYNAETMELDYLNILTHVMNCVAMLIELAVVAHPVKFAHCYIPMIFGSVYAIFSCVYYFSGGTSRDGSPCIYSILNWSKPISASAVCIGGIIFMVVIHGITYVVYRLKNALASKIMKTEGADKEKADIQITDLKF